MRKFLTKTGPEEQNKYRKREPNDRVRRANTWTAKFYVLSKFQPCKSHDLLLKFQTSSDVVCEVLFYIIFCSDSNAGTEYFLMIFLGACIPTSSSVSSAAKEEMGGNA